MEKLSFWSSLGRSFSLLFKNFGEIFTEYVKPFIWLMVGYLLIMCGVILYTHINNLIILIIIMAIGIAFAVKALIRVIVLGPSLSIASKRLFLKEDMDFKSAVAEIRLDGSRLGKVILWLFFYGTLMGMLTGIVEGIAKIINIAILTLIFLLLDILIRILYNLALMFVNQSFGIKKELCAKNCVIDSAKTVFSNFLPSLGIYLISAIPILILVAAFLILITASYTGGTFNILDYSIYFIIGILCVELLFYFIFSPAYNIFKTYWYLRFNEEKPQENV